MEENGIEQSGFKGFVSNRFGRIVELAKLYLQNEDNIKQFFNAVVDGHSYKLVLAVSTFIDNAWFKCCTEVYSAIGDLLIFPLMDLIGIDGRKDDARRRSWEQVRVFFQSQLQSLELHQKNLSRAETGKGRLIGAVINEIIEMLQRQLYEMDFLKPKAEANELLLIPDLDKLKYAPLTNLRCESQLGKFDNRIRFAGGMTTITTHSRMNIVSSNGLLCNPQFVDLVDKDKKIRWKWGSETAQKVKQLEEEFLSTVRASKDMALKKKEELKLKKNIKILQVLEKAMHDIDDIEDNDLSYQDSSKSTAVNPANSKLLKNDPAMFHQVRIREGYRCMNEQLMRCMVHCLASYKVTTNDLYGITVAVANTVFGQQWQVSKTNSDDQDIGEFDDGDDVDDDKLDNPVDKDKKIRWKWGSETAQKVKQLEEEFLSTVRASKDMALKKKEELKLKKNIKILQVLETCKRHGGPVTSSTIPLLERLDQRELLKEIFYLRNIVAPDIRQKKRVKCDTGNFTYETFSEKELRQIIKCTVSPEFRGSCDVESLLLQLLK
ncbi:hypothetical protein LOTGIDRAFT_162043 [Lottia gigantea]|uniref:Uncharacterized protein n=1 Tax=Lottia gigantea TaxID=225164 RepID=V4BVG8_LOTGI|nr:hypothetical protein LOTGIDRAFT_162043 [Lottia gigantea]ESO93019.1 hypothetical protein LOTGIDRAFT_162043 [Lottia gigantea]